MDAGGHLHQVVRMGLDGVEVVVAHHPLPCVWQDQRISSGPTGRHPSSPRRERFEEEGGVLASSCFFREQTPMGLHKLTKPLGGYKCSFSGSGSFPQSTALIPIPQRRQRMRTRIKVQHRASCSPAKYLHLNSCMFLRRFVLFLSMNSPNHTKSRWHFFHLFWCSFVSLSC